MQPCRTSLLGSKVMANDHGIIPDKYGQSVLIITLNCTSPIGKEKTGVAWIIYFHGQVIELQYQMKKVEYSERKNGNGIHFMNKQELV